MNTMHVQWKKDTDGRAGWSVPHGASRRDFLFDADLISKLPRDLRRRDAVEDFHKFAENSEFQRWWLYACGNAHLAQPRFLLHFPDVEAWAIAWELLLGELKHGEPAHVSMVRAVEAPKPPLASRFEDKLRILIVKGDTGPNFAQPELDLDAEVEGVGRGFAEVSGIRANVASPEIFGGGLSELSGAISAHKPHILWFSGHGRASTAGFLMQSGWALPQDLAEAIKASGHIPPYAVFWACHTAAKGKTREIGGELPVMFELLRRAGVHSLLAMQAPVYDGNAAEMARELFLNLAAGRSLDFAAAAARARVFERTLQNDLSLDRDWACPAVWSSAVPEEDLQWNSPPERRLAQLQLAGQGTVDLLQTRIGASFDPREHASSARAWLDLKRTWVAGLAGAENDLHWAATLLAIQRDEGRFVLAIELGSGSPAEALQRWAEEVQRRLGRRDFPIEDFLPALQRLRANPVDGWAPFCRLPGAVVAIRNPPAATESWFWEPIDQANANPVMVFAPSAKPESAAPMRPNWHAEKIEMASPSDFAAARTAAASIIDTLATLDMPASKAQLSAAQLDPDDLSKVASVLIETSAGVILRATAAAYAREHMSAAEQIEAHERCLAILDQRGVRLTSSVRERRVEHCLGANASEAAANEALALFQMYRIEERPRAAIQLLERMSAAKTILPSARIFVAWAYAMLGDIDEADLWLRQFHPRTAYDEAWAEGLRAELSKARGRRDEALEAIERAIAVLDRAAQEAGHQQNGFARERRLYRQDHARIRQYLFRDWERAAVEYEALLKEWRDEPGADIEIAVIMRNYQECLRSLSRQRGDARWEEARDMLAKAWEHLTDHRDTAIAAEVQYEFSKFAEEDGRAEDAKRHLGEAGEIAAKSGHLMLFAIVQARIFWAEDAAPFDCARWTAISQRLSAHSDHGWPVRTLLGGRLRAAKRLLAAANHTSALAELESNRELLAGHPALKEGSDRFKIAATAAGLSMLGETGAWAAFEALDWAADWMREQDYADAQAVWQAVK